MSASTMARAVSKGVFRAWEEEAVRALRPAPPPVRVSEKEEAAVQAEVALAQLPSAQAAQEAGQAVPRGREAQGVHSAALVTQVRVVVHG